MEILISCIFYFCVFVLVFVLSVKFIAMIFCTGAKHVDMMYDEPTPAEIRDREGGIHTIATAIREDLSLDEAEKLRSSGDDRYNEAKKHVYKLLYGGK